VRGACALVLLAACADPRVTVTIQVPPSLASKVDTITLRTIVPPASQPFTCDDLAYGRVSDDILRASESGNIVLRPHGQAPLRDVDRLTSRIFLADVEDTSGTIVAKGCAPLGEFMNDVSVSITAEPSAHAALPTSDLSYTLGAAPPRVQIPIVDANGAPIAGVATVWNLAGAGGSASSGQEAAGPDGVVDFSPTPPDRPGPFVLDLRVRWSATGPLVLSGFVMRPRLTAKLQGAPVGAVVGRVGPGARSAVAVLLIKLGGWFVETYDATSFRGALGQLTPVRSIRVPGSSLLGLLDLPGGPSDQLIVVSTSTGALAWMRIDPLGSVVRTTARFPAGSTQAKHVLRGGPCGPGKSPEMVLIFDNNMVARYDQSGALLESVLVTSDAANVSDSGCVSDDMGNLQRTYVRPAADVSGVTLSVGDTFATIQSTFWFALTFGLAFSPEIGGRSVLIGTQLQINDFVVALERFHFNGSQLALDAVDSDRPPNVPVFTRGADLDSDGGIDVVSILATVDTTGNAQPHSLWASLAQTYAGRRIAGSYTLPDQGLCKPIVLTGDFDGDGTEDILVSEVSRIACNDLSLSSAFFYPMGKASP
jgi:hypothetical protein